MSAFKLLMAKKKITPPPSLLVYSPLAVSYSAASFTDVTLSNTDTLSFWVSGLTTSTALRYIMGSDTSSYLYYRGSDGRFRIADDSGTVASVNTATLSDEAAHFVRIVRNITTTEFYIDGVLIYTANGSFGDTTLNCIGASSNTGSFSMGLGVVYGVTLGTQASWVMQSENPTEFDGVDWVGSNNLTYVDAPDPITESDTIATSPILDV